MLSTRLVRLPALLLASLAFACLNRPSSGAQAAGFQLANWQAQDGLPSNKVMAAVQTSDGYLWIGTYEGLARFDGVAFKRFDSGSVPGFPDNTITTLYESPDHALWIGHDSGAVTRYRDGQFQFFPAPDQRKGISIRRLGGDSAGDVWALNVSGSLIRPRDGLTLTPETGGARSVFDMAAGASGELWIISRGKLSLFRDGKFSTVPLLPRMQNYVQGICARSNGGAWVVAGDGHLWKWENDTWSEEFGLLHTQHLPIYKLMELRDGRLIDCTLDRGATLIEPGPQLRQRELRRETGFPSDWVICVLEDREGSIWLGTGASGLFRLSEAKVQMLQPDDALEARAALSVTTTPDGAIWVGTEGAGVYRFLAGRWDSFSQSAGLTNPYIWSIATDRSGQIWCGSWGSGVYQLSHDKFVRAPGTEQLDTGVAALAPAAAGGMWVGSQLGLFRVHNGKVDWLEPGPERKLKDVRAILEQADGILWVGCSGAGLGRVENNIVQRFTHREGLSNDFVQCLRLDASGALWVGTRGGLNRWKNGRFAQIGAAQGLTEASICDIEDDGAGNFWMSSKSGIVRVSQAELNACADGIVSRVQCVSYGLSDGLATLACSGSTQPAGCKLPDGSLVFATDHGLALINPAKVKRNPTPPPVLIEAVKVEDEFISDLNSRGGVVEVAPGKHRVEIRYTGLSFAAPEKVVFRRQLQPIERKPTYAGTERAAVYSYVPPGRYTFHVTAANNDAVWNEQGQSLTLLVRPYFWQTWWFRVLFALTVVSSAAGFVWWQARHRLKKRLDALERERAVERERTRIAHDMHDDLGAHLTRITMLSDTAQRAAADPAFLQQRLTQVYDTARNVTRAMDEIVWAVNPKHDKVESLISYFEKFALDFLGAAGIRCRLDIPLEFPDWTPSSEVRHQLFLCFKEALNNIVRHAGADTVTITIAIDATTFAVRIADNGRGLHRRAGEENAARGDRIAGGNGTQNMRARMAALGGTCEIIDRAPGGCEVVLRVHANSRAH